MEKNMDIMDQDDDKYDGYSGSGSPDEGEGEDFFSTHFSGNF